MRFAWIHNLVIMTLVLGSISLGTRRWVSSAAERARKGENGDSQVQLASEADDGYCTGRFKSVLRRVLENCGLLGGGRKGCRPADVRNTARIDDEDFNALFGPLAHRGGVILFDLGSWELDEGARRLLERMWAERKGARYFFVVARASSDGPTSVNRTLSHKRANSVLFFLQDRFQDPDLEREVGLLWLGEEYAQLGDDFCDWRMSRPGVRCTTETINRSALVSWIDCRL